MLYSSSIDNDKFNLYYLFLQQTKEGVNSYQDLVDDVLSEAKELAKGEKDLYTIKRENYSIVVFLCENAKEFFESHENSEFTKEDYEKLFTHIETHLDK